MFESLNYLSFVTAAIVTAIATPAAIAVARRTSFYDHPGGYKEHALPTPYLGGVAVAVGFAAGFLVPDLDHSEGLILIPAIGLLLLGTVDDRIGLGIGLRLVAEVAAAAIVFASGFGWDIAGSAPIDFALTVATVLALVNAYNLMDNLDGAASSVAFASAVTICLCAMIAGHGAIAVLAATLAGACAGFLPFNLASPRARIFLGDGGSMAIGVILAALLMSLPSHGFGWGIVPVVVVMVGLPAFDTALVIVSRRRRGVPVLSGGRDHLTHRLLASLATPRRVAIVMAAAQGACGGVAIALLQLSPAAGIAGACFMLAAGSALIAAIEMPRREPRALSLVALARDQA